MEQNTYALHEHCDVGQGRAKLFDYYAQSEDFTIIPGRYGGELNNDMLAIGEKNGSTVLSLGLKALDPNGSFVIDTMSLGPHKQFSSSWLNVLVYSLEQSEVTRHFADAISFARESETLVLEFVFVEPMTRCFTTIRVVAD